MIKKIALVLAFLAPILAEEKRKVDFPALAAQADRYQLPKPPKDAKLVLANTGWTTVLNQSSTDLDPSIYRPGFLLKTHPNGKSDILSGFNFSVAKSRREHQPATLPFTETPPEPKIGGYIFRGNSLTSFSTAVQCARRDDLKSAQGLLKLFLDAEHHDDFHIREASRHYVKNLPLLLARVTYDYYHHETRKSNADLKQVLVMLKKLKSEFPDIFSDDFEEYFKHRRSIFLKNLQFTVNSPKRKKDSIEDLLYQAAYSDVLSHMRTPEHPAYKIYLQGTSAITELVNLSTSRKITPAIQTAVMNSPESRLLLGHLASKALEDMTGVLAVEKTYKTLDGVWKTWLAKNDLSDEKKFFISTLGPPKDNLNINAKIPFAILFHKYPDSAINLANKYSESEHRGDFASALMASTADKETKARALQAVYANQKGLARRYMLQNLARIDPEAVSRELIPLIETLPKDVKTPYWTAEEANLTHVVMQLNDPNVWKAYLAKAKTCSVGLRMELMNPMNYTYIGALNKNLRLAFLAAFLKDTTVRTTKENDPRWKGPYAGFTYDTLSVQNFVTWKIASILKVPGEPGDHWTEEQWTPYRKQVEQALKKLTLPDLSN